MVLPFKDQISADIAKKEMKDLSLKVHHPVFVSLKTEQELNVKKTKSPIIVNQVLLFAVYNVTCVMQDYVGYTHGHLHNRVKGHKQQSFTIAKHYENMHGTMPQDLLKHFKVL